MPAVFAVSWDWILQHLHIVLPVVIWVIYNVLGRNQGENNEPAEPTPTRRPMAEPSRAEPADGLTPEQRAEKIRDEIRRRILERMGQPTGTEAPPLVRPAPAAEQPTPLPRHYEDASEQPSFPRPPEPALSEPVPVPPPVPVFVERDEEPAEEPAEAGSSRESFKDQYRRLQEARELAASTAMAVNRDGFSTAAAAAPASRTMAGGQAGRSSRALLGELRSKDGARRAFVMRELLEKPVALRKG